MTTGQHTRHTLHAHHHHWVWNNALEPVLRVSPGEDVFITTLESSGGQIHENATVADVVNLDFSRVNPVTGPIHVNGAQPGDILVIDILDMRPSGIGWTALIPEFGLLAEHFPDPALKLWRYPAHLPARVGYSESAKVTIRPMLGSIGLAPAANGDHDILPPRRVGGTMDIRDVCMGTTLYLPVEVEGALLSVGDTHAAQGDGEVCGTGLESAIDVSLRIGLVKETPLATPRLELPGPVNAEPDDLGFYVTTGIGPDLMQGCRDSVSGMVDCLMKAQQLSAEDAYMLSSLCADLRISEIVDQPNWVVSFYFPKSVFD